MKYYKPGHRISTVGDDDRPDLEGKTIVYRRADGEDFVGLIVGFNYSVGVTIVDANNKDHYLLCLRGPVCPRTPREEFDQDFHDEVMAYLSAACDRGVVESDVLSDIVKRSGTFSSVPSSSTCAYNQ